MARYILIDSDSGYIWGDTADFATDRQGEFDGAICIAARLLDESLGEHGRAYIDSWRRPDGASGYFVYRADVNGSEAVPVVQDGQDQETIEAVERDCEYVGFVQYESAA